MRCYYCGLHQRVLCKLLGYLLWDKIYSVIEVRTVKDNMRGTLLHLHTIKLKFFFANFPLFSFSLPPAPCPPFSFTFVCVYVYLSA